jgi:hypothetical protein
LIDFEKGQFMGRRSMVEEIWKASIWRIFIAACGGSCCACRKEGPLEQGHIHRRKDGGASTLENLIPLCASCNGRHNKGFTMVDTRPPEWRSNFVKLLAQELGLTRVVYPSPKNGQGSVGVNPAEATNSTRIIDLSALAFESHPVLSHTLPLPSPHAPLTVSAIEATLSALLDLADQARVAPPLPKEKCKDKLLRLIQAHGSRTFMAAGVEFVKQERWLDNDGRITDRTAWETFAANFERNLKKAEERAARNAKQDAEERERQKKYAAERRAEDFKLRWKRYLWAGDVRPWPGMTDDDRAIVEKVRGLPRDAQLVSDEDLKRTEDVLRRERAYRRDHPSKKQALDRWMAKLAQQSLDGEITLSRECSALMRTIRERAATLGDDDPKLLELSRELTRALREE